MTNNVLLTISGMYQADPSIFDGVELPAGADKELLIQNILIKLDTMEILYFNPKYLKWSIATWASCRKHAWERLWAIQTAEYNALHNYDRTESGSTTGHNAMTGTGHSEAGGSSTTATVPFNKAAEQPFEDTGKVTTQSAGDDTSHSEGESNGSYQNHMEGNIGVTTTQEMASAELQLWQWDFYNSLTQEFAKEFCIGVY